MEVRFIQDIKINKKLIKDTVEDFIKCEIYLLLLLG